MLHLAFWECRFALVDMWFVTILLMEARRTQVSGDAFLNCYLFKVSSGCNLHFSGIPCKEVFICCSSKEKSLVLFTFPAHSSPASGMLP